MNDVKRQTKLGEKVVMRAKMEIVFGRNARKRKSTNLFVHYIFYVTTNNMCAISVIYNYGNQFDPSSWTMEKWIQYKKLLDAAKEFDLNTNQSDCEDPNKSAWFKSIDERMTMKDE